MKFIFTLVFIFASFNVWAAPDLNQKITLKMKNVTATEAMEEISRHSNVNFTINPKINFTKKMSIDVEETSLKDVLDFLVAEQNVAWETGKGNWIKIAAVN